MLFLGLIQGEYINTLIHGEDVLVIKQLSRIKTISRTTSCVQTVRIRLIHMQWLSKNIASTLFIHNSYCKAIASGRDFSQTLLMLGVFINTNDTN